MDKRSLRVLEWDKIKNQVADFASFSLGKNMVQLLEPGNDFNQIKANLDLTTAAVKLLWSQSDPPFGGAVDINPELQRASIGGVLDGNELIKVSGLLYCATEMRRYLMKADTMQEYLPRISHNPQLTAEINRCLDDDGTIKDKATPQLASIRQKINSLEHRVRDKLNSIVHSSATQKMLQESIVTLRNGRYVVPVKQEYKTNFGGIVHDQSASGATFFVEPAAVVELNNQLRITHQEEQKEILRILRKLSESVAADSDSLELTLHTLAELDFIFAKAKFSKNLRGNPARINQTGYINIKQGRHPLLTGKVVPVDLWLGDKFSQLVITGPNTGGKTVTLKTVGLFAVMTQAGLHISANEGSEMGIFDNIFADIGDEQSIEQSLSTFSSHMSNIVKIIGQISSKSLVLLDELGAGTDPTEGAALATALLEHLRQQGVATVATTHYSELKNYAYANPEVENASVEFDVTTLKPTYRLAIGVPGKSNAFAIAQRLGLSQDIVKIAKGLLSEDRVQVDDIITELEVNRQKAETANREAEQLRTEYHKLRERYHKLNADLTDNSEDIIAKARQEAEELVSETRKELDLLIGELRKQQNIDLETVVEQKRQELADQQKKFQVRKTKLANVKKAPKDLQKGEQVRIRSLNQVGSVVEIGTNDVLVQAGILRVNVKKTDLERVRSGDAPVKVNHQSKARNNQSKSQSIRSEIDLRGNTVEDALVLVDKYLDDVTLASLAQVRIIHGKGTGALREAIQEQLRTYPYVKSFRLADPSQGGSGVTVVEFK